MYHRFVLSDLWEVSLKHLAKPSMEETDKIKKTKEMVSGHSSGLRFWKWVMGSIILRLILIYFPKNLNLGSRPEVSTPVSSLRRRTYSFLSPHCIVCSCSISLRILSYNFTVLLGFSVGRLLVEAAIFVTLCRFLICLKCFYCTHSVNIFTVFSGFFFFFFFKCAGSMYHGSPLLLSVLGPLAVKRYYLVSPQLKFL